MSARPGAVMVLAVLGTGHAAALELDMVQLDAAVDLGWQTSDTRPIQQELTLEPALEGSVTAVSGFRLSARIRADARDDLEPGKPDLRTYSGATRPATLGRAGTAELRDAYVDTTVGTAHLRLGKQQIVWGSVDGFKILDAVNPQTFREFILADFPDSRIGLWAASVELPLSSTVVQLAWIPDTTVHELPAPDAFFAFRAPRYRFGAPPDAPAPANVRVDRPDDRWEDGGVGARIAGLSNDWDWSVVALSNLDPVPYATIQIAADEPVLVHNYRRGALYGLSLARSLGDVALRAEAAVRPGRRYNTRGQAGQLGVVRHDNVSAALGADVDAPAGVFLSAQLLVDHVRDAAPGLVRPETDWIFTAYARRTFLYETLRAELRWYASLTDGDGVVRPAIAYAVSDNLSVKLGADIFYGKVTGVFGQFSDRDRFVLGLEVVL